MPLNSKPAPNQSHIVRLLIVDDKRHAREGLSRLLRITGEAEVVGGAADGQEAIRQAETLRPDVVLIDLEIPPSWFRAPPGITDRVSRARPTTPGISTGSRRCHCWAAYHHLNGHRNIFDRNKEA